MLKYFLLIFFSCFLFSCSKDPIVLSIVDKSIGNYICNGSNLYNRFDDLKLVSTDTSFYQNLHRRLEKLTNSSFKLIYYLDSFHTVAASDTFTVVGDYFYYQPNTNNNFRGRLYSDSFGYSNLIVDAYYFIDEYCSCIKVVN